MKNKISRIGLFPLHSFARPGGVKRHVLSLNNEFQKKGLVPKIILPRRHAAERYGKNISFLGTAFDLPFDGTQADFTICIQPGEVAKLLTKEKFDVLHFHNFGLHSWQILEKSRSVNILTFHANINNSRLLKTFPFVWERFKKTVSQKIDGIICVAPFQLKLFSDFSGPKIVIPNGVNLDEFNYRVPKIKKYLDGKINILFLGRIEERKGLIYLLQAFALLRKKNQSIRLLVVGEGPLEGECKEYVNNNKVPDVVFEGKIKPEQVPSYYNTCDIFVSPAIFGESFGMVLIEAMACAKPVVAFANEGYKGVLVGKGSNFLAPPKNWRVLAKKISILLEHEHDRRGMSKWGLQQAQHYAWPKIAERVLAFYDKAASAKNIR